MELRYYRGKYPVKIVIRSRRNYAVETLDNSLLDKGKVFVTVPRLLWRRLRQEKDSGKCWLCLRTTPQTVLEVSHRLFPGDAEKAHEVGMLAASVLKEAYLKKPAAPSGLRTQTLIAGALYIACLLLNTSMNQREVAMAVNTTEPSVRRSYQILARTLGILQDWPETYRSRPLKPLRERRSESGLDSGLGWA